MQINISNTELDFLNEILHKELDSLGKEIHRTDALTYKQELVQKETKLKELLSRLQQTQKV